MAYTLRQYKFTIRKVRIVNQSYLVILIRFRWYNEETWNHKEKVFVFLLLPSKYLLIWINEDEDDDDDYSNIQLFYLTQEFLLRAYMKIKVIYKQFQNRRT